VADVARALLAAEGTSGIFNIATGVETSVADLLGMLQEAAGTDLEPELLPLREGELERSMLDASHAADVLGWRAEIPLAEGLAATYAAITAPAAG
jgi:UDP-glucose 4-epimerase